MRIIILISILILSCSLHVAAQSNGLLSDENRDYSNEEQVFYAETKQVSQFLRRFNAEEDLRGVKLSPRDPDYHSTELRRKYINMLFNEAGNIPELLRNAFINDVTQPGSEKFLEFHGGGWFGELQAKFRRGNNQIFITLFMNLVKENLGSKWVINDVYYSPYQDLYKRDDNSPSRFLHPLSHELDFMNLDKVFSSGIHMADYFNQGYEVDRLSIFLYELRSRQIKFEFVTEVKFHFFQLDGWYVEISEYNRPGMNRGWLISNLIKLEDGQADQLKDFIYHR